jgi:hypothetical protein
MSFRSLTHYFVHRALAGWDEKPEPEPEPEPDAQSWESTLLRSGDERRLQGIGRQIEEIELDSELLTEAGHVRLQEVNALLHLARVACWKL